MQRTAAIEPGIIQAFRLFTVVRLTFFVVNFAMDFVRSGALLPSLLWPFFISLFDVALLMVYLSWPRLQGLLKSWYLPLGIILASLGPIFEQYLPILFGSINAETSTTVSVIWQSVIVLLIPLFITGWQYSMRAVALFCLSTAAVDLIPILIWMHSAGLPRRVMFPVVAVYFVRTVSFFLTGLMVVRLMKTQRRLRSELSEANARLAHYAGTLEQLTVSRERNRLARELHDVLAHTLSGVAVELEAVRVLWKNDPGQAQAMLDHSLDATRAGLTETRRALQALRASPLEDLGLALAVRNLAETAANRSGLDLRANIPERLPDFPAEVEHTAYRVAEEALRNVSEHAGAREVRVDLLAVDGRLELRVMDDGKGFDPRGVDSQMQFGLAGMRERAEAIGGRLSISTSAGGGTQVFLQYGEASA